MNDFIDKEWFVLDDLKKELNGIIDKAYNIGHHKGCETTKQLLQMSYGMNKPCEEGSPHEMTDQVDGWKQGYQAAIDELRAINAIRPKGKWIDNYSARNEEGFWRCSVCGREIFLYNSTEKERTEEYPYCHCGADMRGEE